MRILHKTQKASFHLMTPPQEQPLLSKNADSLYVDIEQQLEDELEEEIQHHKLNRVLIPIIVFLSLVAIYNQIAFMRGTYNETFSNIVALAGILSLLITAAIIEAMDYFRYSLLSSPSVIKV